MTVLVNDVQSRLNPTAVAEIVMPTSIDELQVAVRGRRPIALCGGRHAMGGQQFRSQETLVDTSRLARVLSVDDERGLVEAEAGARLGALDDALAASRWSIAQTVGRVGGLSVGGAVSANAELGLHPVVADVERLLVVGPDGEERTCSRDASPAVFRLVVGGYGLVGAIATVTLRLAPRARLARATDVVEAKELVERFADRLSEGCLDGEVALDCDPASAGFLQRGVLTSCRPVDGEVRIDRAGGVAGGIEPAWPGSSVMLTALVVPRPALAAFLAAAARELCERQASVARCIVRLAVRDDVTVLAWARGDVACVEIGLHVEHDPAAVGRAADAFRTLIDVALAHDGTYRLTHHRWARRDQLERAYPRMREFMRAKREHDPDGVFQSDWFAHVCRLLEAGEAGDAGREADVRAPRPQAPLPRR